MLESQVDETRYQGDRLKHIYDIVQQKPASKTCDAMLGLLKEVEEVLGAAGDKQVKDAVLVGALQRVKHYEVAGYRTAVAFAEQLGLDEIAETLEQTLDEETQSIKKLTRLAEGRIFRSGLNVQAGQAGHQVM
jgi:ferritin-like metal-binding protein YciE